MIKNIYDYFENLQEKELPRNRHNLILDNDKIKVLPQASITPNCKLPDKLLIDGVEYYTKKNNFEYTVADIASTNMMNKIGIPTPPISTVDKPKKRTIITTTQDVNSIKPFKFSIAANVLLREEILKHQLYSTSKWDFLYRPDIKDSFLQHMTEDCYNQLIGMYLVDEIRSECDRHENNYFFYKSHNAEKYEGIMPIDNELLGLLSSLIKDESDFGNFLYYPYISSTLLSKNNYKAYCDRMREMKELLQDGVLTPEQIELMKRAISYDLPTEVKKICKNPRLKEYQRYTYEAVSRLWDYHQYNLGRELEM